MNISKSKFIFINIYNRKAHISDLGVHLKTVERKQTNKKNIKGKIANNKEDKYFEEKTEKQ